MNNPLGRRLRVLLLEDHDLVATVITLGIEKAGHIPIGPFESCHAAQMTTLDYDAAILDISLTDGPPFAFAKTLLDRGLPFLFYTGSEPHHIPAALTSVPILLKRSSILEVVAVLEHLALARELLPIACPWPDACA